MRPSSTSRSEEYLINSSTNSVDKLPKNAKPESVCEFFVEASSPPSSFIFQSLRKFGWTNSCTGTVLRVQIFSIIILAWLLILIHGSNLPIKTNLNSDFVPLWSFWVIAIYSLSLCIGFSFHSYPSMFGILISAILQMMTLAFSIYFELITFSAIDEHGSLDKNDTTRLWGAIFYSTIFVANTAIIFSSLILIFISFRDVCCGKHISRNHLPITQVS